MLQMLANAELAKVSNWMMANNLIIETTKVVALFISPNLCKPVTDLFLTFNNETVYTSNTAKYLGVLLDNELSLKSHIISLEKKIVRFIGVISKVSYYLLNNGLLSLYYFLVHTHLLYAISL